MKQVLILLLLLLASCTKPDTTEVMRLSSGCYVVTSSTYFAIGDTICFTPIEVQTTKGTYRYTWIEGNKYASFLYGKCFELYIIPAMGFYFADLKGCGQSTKLKQLQ